MSEVWQRVFFLALGVAFAVAFVGGAVTGSPYRPIQHVDSIYYDRSEWRAIPLPDSMLLCHYDSIGYAHCVPLPDGTIVMFPMRGHDEKNW